MTNKPMLSVERVHCLKIHRKPFLDLESGGKTGEIRDCSDRDFQVGDNVILVMVDETGNPTPKELHRKITHVQTGYGLPDHLCVLSYEPAAQHQGEQAGYVIPGEMPAQSGYTKTINPASEGKYTLPLYAEHPAPVAVVMPERKPAEWRGISATFASGWNACLDEVARLNRVKP